MANIVEYTLRLQDKFSNTLNKIGASTVSIVNRVQGNFNRVSSSASLTSSSIKTLRERIEQLRSARDLIPARNLSSIKQANKEIEQLERRIAKLQNTGGSALKNAFSSLPFASILTNPLLVAGAGLAQSFRKGFERDSANISFEVLLGSKDKAKKMIDELNFFGSSTPYQTSGLQENAKMMLSFGIASEKILPNLRAIGDISMGDSNKMQSLTLAFSQMTSTGKLMGQDLLQMINAGFNPLSEISRTTGKSIAQLKDEMSKGLITAEMVTNAFISATSAGGKFAGMTQKLGESASGKFSTIMDNLQEAFIDFYNVIKPLVIPVLQYILKLVMLLRTALQFIPVIVRAVASAFAWWIEALDKGNPFIIATTTILTTLVGTMLAFKVQAMAMALWTGIITKATNLWTIAQNLLNLAFWANPITWIVAGIIALIAVIAYVAYKTEGWGKTWNATMEWIKLSAKMLGEFLKLSFQGYAFAFLSALDVMRAGWYKFKSLWDKNGAEEGLRKIQEQRDARLVQMAETANKIKELRQEQKNLQVWQVSWNKDKKLSDIFGGIKKGLGIKESLNPTAGGGDANGISDLGATTGTGGLTDVNAVAGGGARNTSVNITLENLVGNIVFQDGYEGSREEMQKDIESMLIRVLQMAQTAI